MPRPTITRTIRSQPSDQFTSGIVENEASTLFLMRLAALAGVGLLVFSATRRICDP